MLSKLCVDVKGRKVVVLGSGGASKTVQAVLGEQGAQVVVVSRKGEDNYHNISRHKDASLVVNATPVGMYPNGGISPLSEEQISLMDSLYDIVYNPAETELLKIARKLGKTCGGGLSMLVCQAQKSQYYWLGAEFIDEETEKVIKSAEAELERVFGK
jgi:shikimate dehydrogenase